MITEEEITVEWHRFAALQTVSRRMLENAEFSLVRDSMFGSLVARLSAEVLGLKTGSEERKFAETASWRDHFKRDALDRRGLRWLRRRLKIRYVTHTVRWEQGLYFPDAQYPKELGKPVRFLRRTDSRAEDEE